MEVVKRRGEITEVVNESELTLRLSTICDPIDESYVDFPAISTGIDKNYVNPKVVAAKVARGLGDKMTSSELDELMAEQAASQIVSHPDFGKLAARIVVSSLHKATEGCAEFSQVTVKLRNAIHPSTRERTPIVGLDYYNTVMENADRLNNAIDYKRDFLYSFFSIKTLESGYLLRVGNEVVERPQHMLMRVAVGIHGDDIDAAIETYDLMSKLKFTHASPTLFNAGTSSPQLSSCFLLGLQKGGDRDGIYQTVLDTTKISSMSRDIGLHIHDMPAERPVLNSSDKRAPGVIRCMKVFNQAIKWVNQGVGNKRKARAAYYLEPWHNDIIDVIQCRRNTGSEEFKTRELFPALWIPDEFMRRVERMQEWTLMCPTECPGLSDVYGKKFDALYRKYEKEGKGKQIIKAQALWKLIVDTKIETGTPYICFKDNVNKKSNHSNIGVIKSSNLCTEIVQFSDSTQTAVCNLASVAVNQFVKRCPVSGTSCNFDHLGLKEVVKVMVKNLNKIIDITHYPTDKAMESSVNTRPIGLGVQGLADAFIMLRLPFDSDGAKKLNREIFETIYFSALEASCELARVEGTYKYYEGSPISKGIFHFDMCRERDLAGRYVNFKVYRSMHDWETLKSNIEKHGVRNSTLVAPMPTACTAQILGNAESFEPYTSVMLVRKVLAGSIQVLNESLVRDLISCGQWSEEIRNRIIANGGSIQSVDSIPDDIKVLYRTAWEINQRNIIDMAADRGLFVDQSQSVNLHMAEPSFAKVSDMYFYAWRQGLKTTYYLRTKAAARLSQGGGRDVLLSLDGMSIDD